MRKISWVSSMDLSTHHRRKLNLMIMQHGHDATIWSIHGSSTIWLPRFLTVSSTTQLPVKYRKIFANVSLKAMLHSSSRFNERLLISLKINFRFLPTTPNSKVYGMSWPHIPMDYHVRAGLNKIARS